MSASASFAVLLLAAAVSANVRVEYKLLSYTNEGGLLANGKTCGRSGCDPKIYGYVDTEKALNAWPGAMSDTSKWAQIFEAKETDKANLNKIVSRDVCGGDFKKANLRAKVEDVNRIMSNDPITQFECLTGSGPIGRSESSSSWSDPKVCDGLNNPTKVKMTFQWRAYNVPASECGRSTQRKP